MLIRKAAFVAIATLLVAPLGLAQNQESNQAETQNQGKNTEAKQNTEPDQSKAHDGSTHDAYDKKHGDKLSKDMGPLTAEKVLCKLHETNMTEIEMGKLAIEKGQSQEIKDLGQTLVTDHQKANQKVKELAKAQNISLDKSKDTSAQSESDRNDPAPGDDKGKPENPADAGPVADDAKRADSKGEKALHADMQEGLKDLSGAEFDQHFAAMMAKDHMKTIALLEKVKSDSTLTEIKPLADELLPTLQKHEQMAKDLSQTLGEPTIDQARRDRATAK